MATKVRALWVSNRSILRVTPKEPFKAWAEGLDSDGALGIAQAG
jgi:hypothetical protein